MEDIVHTWAGHVHSKCVNLIPGAYVNKSISIVVCQINVGEWKRGRYRVNAMRLCVWYQRIWHQWLIVKQVLMNNLYSNPLGIVYENVTHVMLVEINSKSSSWQFSVTTIRKTSVRDFQMTQPTLSVWHGQMETRPVILLAVNMRHISPTRRSITPSVSTAIHDIRINLAIADNIVHEDSSLTRRRTVAWVPNMSYKHTQIITDSATQCKERITPEPAPLL